MQFSRNPKKFILWHPHQHTMHKKRTHTIPTWKLRLKCRTMISQAHFSTPVQKILSEKRKRMENPKLVMNMAMKKFTKSPEPPTHIIVIIKLWWIMKLSLLFETLLFFEPENNNNSNLFWNALPNLFLKQKYSFGPSMRF